MSIRSVDLDYPTVLLVVLVGVLVVSAIFAMSTSSDAFGPYNRAWDGSSELRSIARDGSAETVIITNATNYASVPAQGTLAVVLSPQESYTAVQINSINRFVANGGTVLIAEDFGTHSNDLLAGLGATSRVDGRLLRDARNHHRSSALPVAQNISGDPLLDGVDGITLNYGTAVVTNSGEPLVSTSEFGYLDENSDGQLDDAERLGTYPVLVREEVGSGSVIVLGDPSALINVMLDRPGNRAFVNNLVSQHDRLILDYSHSGQLPPIALGLHMLRGSASVQIVLGLAIIGLFLLIEQIPRRITRVMQSSSEGSVLTSHRQQWMINYLTRKHPDWEEERIRRVVNSVLRSPDQLQNND